MFLAAKASKFFVSETALHIAILKQDLPAVKELLRHGAHAAKARTSGTCFVPGERASVTSVRTLTCGVIQ